MYNMSDKSKLASEPMNEQESYRQQYEITLLLGEKFFNTELGKFLFAKDHVVMVSDTNKVVLTTDDTWFIRDVMNIDGVLEATIKRV